MGQSAFGTLLKRGDGALHTVTLATVLAADTLIIDGLTFTAHATVTTAALREFKISGATDTLDAIELALVINDATYGVPNLTATPVAAVITLYNDGVLSDENDTITVTPSGATLTVAAAVEAFTTLGEITNVSGPNFSMESIDTTSHTSPSGYRQTVPSFKSIGEITADLNYDPTAAQQDFATGLLFDFENRTIREWKIVYPTSPVETFTFAARVTGFQPTAPVDGKLAASITLTGSGPAVQS